MAYSSSGFGNPFGFSLTPWVKRLLIANVAVFIITLAFPRLVIYLQLTPALVLLQPWTLLTYMFVHSGPWHLLGNMLGLFFFGPPLEERWGSRAFLKFYLLTGLAGALLSFLFMHHPIVGASAAIYGILVAYAMYWPDNPVYIYAIFPVKVKWLVTILIGIAVLFSLTGGQGGVAHLAHLGGAAAAFLYLKSGWGPSAWGEVARPKRPRKWRVFSRTEEPPRREPAAPSAARTARARDMRQALDEVDRILDKISSGGLASLSEEERRQLDEASRRFRSN